MSESNLLPSAASSTSVSSSSVDLHENLSEALEHLRLAHSQDNTKSKKIVSVFDEFSTNVAVSFIKARNQIGNRFKEQKSKLAPYTIFLFTEEDLLENSFSRITEYNYPELISIFFFYYDGSAYRLVRVATRGQDDSLTGNIIAAYAGSGSSPQVTDLVPASGAAGATEGLTTSEHATGRLPDLDLQVSISLDQDPCELVGLRTAFAQAVASLRAGKHVLLVGPPGTAKTELAECICRAFKAEFRFSTATAEWSSFETLGGYFAQPNGGQTVIDFHEGLITEAIRTNRWLIVDEFNRADMDKAFGELFTVLLGKTVLLPYRKVCGNKALPIQIGKDASGAEAYNVLLGGTWRMIAAMNSADKASLARLSLALMRRFAVVHIDPPPPAEYAALLDSEVLKLKAELNSIERASLGKVNEALKSLLCGAADTGFSKFNLAFGPAIPLDILRYSAKRLMHLSAGGLEARMAAVEGLTQSLFPQLEGRDDIHQQVVDLVSTTLSLAPDESSVVGCHLAVFTGFRAGS